MKSPTGPAAAYITIIAMTTAAIMISISSAMPIAVMIESSENTRSIATNCATTKPNAVRRLLVVSCSSLRLDLGVDLVRRLGDQEQCRRRSG